jgi:CHASE2 domain-containing sensor protein
MIRRKKTWKERIEIGRIVGVLTTLLLVGFGSYYFEDIKEHLPDITTLQLQTYDWLSRITSRKPRPQWVVGVEIDNQTFFDCLGLVGRDDVTDRAFLATLIDRAVAAHAAVIALDINLDRDDMDQSDDKRRGQNRAFFDAIRRSQQAGIPVVLTQGFDYKSMQPLDDIRDGVDTAASPAAGPERWNCQPAASAAVQSNGTKPPGTENDKASIPTSQPVEVQETLPPRGATQASASAAEPGVRAGFDFAPMDKRRVPLMMDDGHSASQALEKPGLGYPSFALQVVDAYESSTGITPRTAHRLRGQMRQGYFVYTSFLPEYSHFESGAESSPLERGLHKLNSLLGISEEAPENSPPDFYKFPHVSAKDVYDGDAAALGKLEHRIVLIGGHREERQGSSEWLDYHRGPQGPMLGMYLHANYIEGLLDNRIKLRIGRWTGVLIDLGLAALIMFAGAKARKSWQRGMVMLVAFVLSLLLYLVAAVFGYGRDVLAVLLIVLLHTGWEHYLHLQERAHEKSERGLHEAHS